MTGGNAGNVEGDIISSKEEEDYSDDEGDNEEDSHDDNQPTLSSSLNTSDIDDRIHPMTERTIYTELRNRDVSLSELPICGKIPIVLKQSVGIRLRSRKSSKTAVTTQKK